MDVMWGAVLLAGVINMVVGAIWYAPGVFGKIWARELGMKPDQPMDSSGMGKGYAITFVGALVMAFVTALVIRNLGSDTVAKGLAVGFWLWLGYALTIPLNDVVFGKKTLTLYSLNAAYYLVVLLINGVMLSVWR